MTFGQRFAVFTRDKFTCQYCGRTGAEVILEIDHVLPQAAGGTNDLGNLMTACHPCNRGKAARVITASPEPERARVLLTASEMSKLAAKARLKKIPPERRQEIARTAARARWDARKP